MIVLAGNHTEPPTRGPKPWPTYDKTEMGSAQGCSPWELEIRTREGAEPIRPGLYFLRARANGTSAVRRLTVIR